MVVHAIRTAVVVIDSVIADLEIPGSRGNLTELDSVWSQGNPSVSDDALAMA